MQIKKIFAAASTAIFAIAFTAQASSNSITLPTPTTTNSQTWMNNSNQNIQWSVPSTGATSNANISLIPYSTSGCSTPAYGNTTTCYTNSPYIVGYNIPNNGSYNAMIGTDVTGRAIPAGQYLVNVYDANNNNLTATGTSSQIITIPSYSPSYTAPSNFSLYPNSGAPGTVVTLNGAGLATSSNSSIQFGNGSYVNATGQATGNSLQFIVPGYTQPCSSALYPATVNGGPTTYTSAGVCTTASNTINPGVYNVTVNSNGNTYTLPFTVTAASTSTQSGNLQLSPNSGAPGTLVTVSGTGLSALPNSSIQFGNGSYISASGNTSGNSLQFTVPSYTQPCSSSLYPATITNTPNTSTSVGNCNTAASLIAPGVYNVQVMSNGNLYTVPFTVTSYAGGGTGLMIPSNNFPDGTLVQVSGNPTVYLVSNGQFQPFNSAAIFLGRGYQWSLIQTIPQAELNTELLSATPVTAANGAIIKTADNPTIYLIVNGERSGIPSMAVFNRLGLKLSNLIIVGDQDLQNYPRGTDQM